MTPGRPLSFIALGLFGLYVVEFGVVGVLPSIVDRYDVSVDQADRVVGFFALIVAAAGPVMVVWLACLDRRRVLTGTLLVFSLCSLLSAWAPNYAVLMALRVPSALLHPVFFSVAFATAASLYPPERATHATTMAYIGTSMGLVLGVPLSTWIDARISYAAAFYFAAAVNLVAALGLWFMLPAAPGPGPTERAGALHVLRSNRVWLSIGATVAVFAAMFSVYSYAAAYLSEKTGLDGELISLLLVVFGIGGVAGNLLAGRWLSRRLVPTVLTYPVMLAFAYAVLAWFTSSSLWDMLPICLLWGAVHTSGLIVCQVWLISAAPDAPAFATSLFVSSANFGTVCGTTLSGRLIEWHGLDGTLWSGWLFAAIAVGLVLARSILPARYNTA
ncbi:MFS transporter [Salinisphaera sp. T31B1]|uniref:MFS transporter n=1 Tax=Salinisphaera sp. T31B1 TaxID=727963 RepID=UPI00333EA00E